MKKSESEIIADLVDGVEVQLDYKDAIKKENKKFKGGGGLKARQEKVNAKLEREFGIKLNSKGGNEMKKQGGVKQKKTTAKVTPKVDLKLMETKATELLSVLKNAVDANGLLLKFAPTKAGYCSYKVGNRLVFGMKYSSRGTLTPIFTITEQQYKALGIKGNYGASAWWAEYPFKNGDDIKKFVPIAELACKNRAPEPKAVTKPVVKKNKKIVKTI